MTTIQIDIVWHCQCQTLMLLDKMATLEFLALGLKQLHCVASLHVNLMHAVESIVLLSKWLTAGW